MIGAWYMPPRRQLVVGDVVVVRGRGDFRPTRVVRLHDERAVNDRGEVAWSSRCKLLVSLSSPLPGVSDG